MASSRTSKSKTLAVTKLVVGLLIFAMMYFFADRFTDGRLTDEVKDRVDTSSSAPGLDYTDAELDQARTAIELVGTASDSKKLADAYDRAKHFGGWRSTDGCDTRQRILARDLDDLERHDDCDAMVGTLDDPYTGKTLTVRNPKWAGPLEEGEIRISEVEIDHIVPLSRAWMHGAHTWTKDERVEFANDFDNLLAVDGPANSAKRDHGPSTWMPAHQPSACGYIVKYVLLIDSYDLTMTPDDKRSAHDTLEDCA